MTSRSRPTFLFVESNTTGTGLLFLRRARSLGKNVVLVSRDVSRYRFGSLPWLRIIDADTTNDSCTREVVLGACAADGLALAAVWSTSDVFIGSAARLAQMLGLPGPDPDAVALCRRKEAQSDLLRRAGIHIPRTLVASSTNGTLPKVRSLDYPVVVKPAIGSGSVGVQLCETPERATKHAYELANAETETSYVLVQEFVDGPELSVEVFHGIAKGVVHKHLGPTPYFVEVGHDFPASLPSHVITRVMTTAERAVRVLGLTWGPAHVELRLRSDGKPVVIEVNPRLAGGMIPVLMTYAGAVDLIDATLRAALGQSQNPKSEPYRASSIRFLTASRSGAFTKVSGLRTAMRLPGVREVRVYPRRSEHVGEPIDFRSRVAHVMAVGSSAKVSGRAADDALAVLDLELAVDG